MTSIGQSAFNNCTGITTLNLPATGQLSIGNSAFRDTGITGTLTIPFSVTSIGPNAFRDTDISGTLAIPSSVTSIGEGAFSGTNISAFVFTGDTAPTMWYSIRRSGGPSYYPSGWAYAYSSIGITDPANQTVTPGQNASFNIAVTGGIAGCDYVYKWRVYNNAADAVSDTDGTGGMLVTNAGTYSDSGADTDTLTVTGDLSLDGKHYKCFAEVENHPALTIASQAAKLTVTSSSLDASITPTTATFDKYVSHADYKDITVTLSLGSYALQNITYGGTALIAGTDYTVNGDAYTIKKEYLATLATSQQVITFNMSGGTNPTLTITVSDSTPQAVPVTGVTLDSTALTVLSKDG